MQTGDPTGTGRGGESVYRSFIFIMLLTFVLTKQPEYCDNFSFLCN